MASLLLIHNTGVSRESDLQSTAHLAEVTQGEACLLPLHRNQGKVLQHSLLPGGPPPASRPHRASLLPPAFNLRAPGEFAITLFYKVI